MIVIVTCHIGYCLRLSRKTPSFFCCCCYCCGFCSLFLVCFFASWSIFWRKKKRLKIYSNSHFLFTKQRGKCDLFLFVTKEMIFGIFGVLCSFCAELQSGPPVWGFVSSHNECDVSKGQEETHVSNVLTTVSPTLTSISETLRNLYISVDWLYDHMRDRWR